jgi:rpsU-divergently transcribed protein
LPDHDDETKRAALARLLVLADNGGFSGSALAQSGFGGTAAEAVAFWSETLDSALADRLKVMDLLRLPIRERISAGVLARLALLKPHKQAARKAAGVMALPQHLGTGAGLMWKSADVIWRAAGDSATDFNFYTKRTILSGVLSATLIAWFGDDSEDERQTAAFLAARIDNVLQYEKLKARIRTAWAAK